MANDTEKSSLKKIEKYLETISKNTKEMNETSKQTKNALNELNNSNEKVGRIMLILTFMFLYIGFHQFFSINHSENILKETLPAFLLTLIIALWLYHDIYKK